MADGSEWIIAAVVMIVGAAIAIIYTIETWPQRIEPDQPYGDAMETDRMIHNAKRANHKRSK